MNVQNVIRVAEQEVSTEIPFYSTSNSTPHAGCEQKRWQQG